MEELVKRIAKAILWPLSRFFDPRFEGINQALHANTVATLEATTLLGRSIADLQAQVDADTAELRRLLEETHREAAKASRSYFQQLLGGSTDDIDADVASVLDRETGAEGFAAQRGLWFNPPVWVGYDPGDVVVRAVNERIAEVPHVFRALLRLDPGARILDVGASESTVALSLASLGYDVTALDVRPYPFSHPRLRSIVAAVEDWETKERFDAVVCLSTIEHIGLGAYGEESSDSRADLAAMRRMHQLTKPNGLLVLTTRFGEPDVDELQRTYDKGGLDELLEGWKVEDLTILRREDETTWIADGAGQQPPDTEAVALVTATRAKAPARRRSR
jgi:SAM-dependent methyltransferase